MAEKCSVHLIIFSHNLLSIL